MSRINLDNPKTYHQNDTTDIYDQISKFGRHFEKGFHESQVNQLPVDLQNITSFIICTDGSSRHIADFCLSLNPFFLKVPFEISTNFRLPTFANKNSLIFIFSEKPHSSEIISVKKEADNKDFLYINPEYQSTGHTLGFLFGLLTRLNPDFSKTINTEEIFLNIEKTISRLNKDINEPQNPAKQLAQKHSQKAVLLLGSGHLQGVTAFGSGIVRLWAKTFSSHFFLPEVEDVLADLLTHPSKVLNEYQFLILNSDLYSTPIQSQVENAKKILSQKRVNFTLLKPDSNDWFNQIFESLVFLLYFSYYLSIVNKANN